MFARDLPAPPRLDCGRAALFLDLDGTLAPLAAHPDDVGPQPRRTRLLRGLDRALDGALAVVTGRTLADADRILEGSVAAVAAVHGLVRRHADGTLAATPLNGALAKARAQLGCFAAARPGLFVEDKEVSAALHFRGRPQEADAAHALAQELAARHGLIVQEGAMVVELRPPGPDKGEAVRAFMAQPPFAGRRPLFVGDDLTDEAGFEAALNLGGTAVVVGDRRPTRARAALADVGAVLAWLETGLETGLVSEERP